MSLSYKAVARKNPLQQSEPAKFYVSPVPMGRKNLHNLSKEIAERCSLNRTDVLAVLDAMLQVIPDFLDDGFKVALGDFGSFHITFNSKGAETEEECTPAMITGKKLRFSPGSELKTRIETLKISKGE